MDVRVIVGVRPVTTEDVVSVEASSHTHTRPVLYCTRLCFAMHLRHFNKSPKQYSYEVILHDVVSLSLLLAPPPSHPLAPPFRVLDPFVLSVHSRSKQNQTRVSVLQTSSIVFDESLSFTSTLFLSSSSVHPSFDAKRFTFTLTNLRLQQERQKAFVTHSATLDLALFASVSGDETEQPHTLPLLPDKGAVDCVPPPELRLTIRSRYAGEGVASETSLLSSMGRGSRSATSQMRGVEEHSRLRRWREKGEEKEEEEEVAMRRKEREEETTDPATDAVEYRMKLDAVSDDDSDEKRASAHPHPVPDDAGDRNPAEAVTGRRTERRRTFDAKELFRADSRKKAGARQTPSSLADILPALRAASPSSTEHLEALSTLDPPSPVRSQTVGVGAKGGKRRDGEAELKEGKKPLKKSLSASSTSSTSSSSSSSTIPPPAPRRSPLAQQPTLLSPVRANVHLPPTIADVSSRDEHEKLYRQRMEGRLSRALSALFPGLLYSSEAFRTDTTSLATLPALPGVFFAAFTTLQHQLELDEERQKEERARWVRLEEQRAWLRFTSTERRRWQSQRERDRADLEALRREDEQRRARRDKEDAAQAVRAADEQRMCEELRAVSSRWYFHSYPIAGVTLYRLLVLCHAFHADVEEREVDADDGEEPTVDGTRVRKKKVRLKRPPHQLVRVTTARRAWVMEAVLRTLRRRAEESRDHYGHLLWLINAVIMLHRCVLRRRDAEEGAAGDREDVLGVRPHDFGVATPVNGKAPTQGAGGGEQAVDGPSSTTCFVPCYPFLSSDAGVWEYNGSALSATLSPLSWFVHQLRGLLLALVSLLFHHLSFALSQRVPLSAILSPASFSLETVLDLLSDAHQLLSLSEVRDTLRVTVLEWMMDVVSTRVVNAVFFEVQRALVDVVDADAAAAYELPLTPLITKPPTPLPALPSPSNRQSPHAASQPLITPDPPPPVLFTDASSFLSLGMRLMMIASALRDWMARHSYAANHLASTLSPLHSLAMLCLAERAPGGQAVAGGVPGVDRRAGRGSAEADRAEGEGTSWERGGEGRVREQRLEERRVWVRWPGEVEVQLGWEVVPFAAFSVGLPPGLQDSERSKEVDGLLDADGLLIT